MYRLCQCACTSNYLSRLAYFEQHGIIYYQSVHFRIINQEQIVNIDGFQVKTGKQFIDNFEGFRSFMSGLNLEYYVKTEESTKNVNKNPNIDGKYFVMTGFRDIEIIDYIDTNGGTLQNDVNMKTEYLIVKDLSSSSGKIKKAKIMGVEIIDANGFNKLK